MVDPTDVELSKSKWLRIAVMVAAVLILFFMIFFILGKEFTSIFGA